jgi:hypothetical protein
MNADVNCGSWSDFFFFIFLYMTTLALVFRIGRKQRSGDAECSRVHRARTKERSANETTPNAAVLGGDDASFP